MGLVLGETEFQFTLGIRATGILPTKLQPGNPKMEIKAIRNEKENPISLYYSMLTRSNYAAWAIKMRVFMQSQGVWEAIEPRTRNTVIDVKKDKLALAAIYQGTYREMLLLTGKDLASTKDAWETLKTMFYRELERVQDRDSSCTLTGGNLNLKPSA
ncbi:ribonuclease H-like domain, reverse transcriptase, RNA-dependent DNA polymerase [Tanacetum coccineum]